MGCVIANVKCQRLDAPIFAYGLRLDAPIFAYGLRLDAPIFAYGLRLDSPIKVTCSIICDIGVGEFIRFALSTLQWVEDDNAVGVVKYNELIASGEWSLEEITIEELL